MRISKATPKAVRYACMNFHYAKAVPSARFAYSVFNDKGEWCGVIIYGSGANNSIGKPFGLFQGEILELVRVALNGKQETTSQAVAMTLRKLHQDEPQIKMIVSYADLDQDHAGTIYQATNWLYLGIMMQDSQDSSWVVNGKRYHGRVISDWVRSHGGLHGLTREQFIHKYYDENAYPYITKGKHKYIMVFDKKMRKKLLREVKPYPKKKEE